MNSGLKAILYGILLIAVAVTGYFFFQSFGKLFEEEKPRATVAEVEAAPEVSTNTTPETNVAAEAVAATTNAAPATNVVAQMVDTNAAPETNVALEVTAPVATEKTVKAKPSPGAKGEPKPRIGAWTGGFLLSVILLGAMIAWDVSNYFGNKTLRVLYNDDDASKKDPEYEQAEQVWADGQPLEAIRMMRGYLNKNPREVHVALRIAEIYEKDLSNFLAAALEYEEVLKKKLPDDRWGWSAIHLCNLYFKLGQEVKSYALLQRVVRDYGHTAAATKARKRLSEVDPVLLAEAEASAPKAAADSGADDEPPAPPEPKSNLPPGFRPRK